MFIKLMWVGLGGFLGAMGRYGVGQLVEKFGSQTLPYGTLLVNIVGCFCIGGLMVWGEAKGWLTEELRLFLIVGLLGGFTTFSAFGLEALSLLRTDAIGAFLIYTGGHILLGLGAVALSMWLVRTMI